MAEVVVPWRKEINDSLSRQDMQNIRGLHRKGLAKREEEEQMLLSEGAHKQVLTVEKNLHLILHSSSGVLVTVAISTSPGGGFHRGSMCTRDVPLRRL